MIVQDETSNGSHSMHSAASGSQLAFVPSAQAPKQQHYKQQWRRKGTAESSAGAESARNKPASFRQHSVNRIKVIVLVDSVVLDNSPLGAAIKAEFQQHEESLTDEKFQLRGLLNSSCHSSGGDVVPSSRPSSSSLTTTTATATSSSINTDSSVSSDASTTAPSSSSSFPANHTIRWTRSNLSAFDSIAATTHTNTTTTNTFTTSLPAQSIPSFEPFTLLVADAEAWLQRMLCSPDGVEFVQLGLYVQDLFAQSNTTSNTSASKILALVDLDKAALRVQRQISKEGQGNRDVPALVDSAVSYLLYDCDIEVFRCKRDAELAEYVYTLTRLVSNRVAETVVTEIDCVAKAQKERMPEGLDGPQREQFELQQTWSAMLQMLPLMSKDKAQTLIAQPSFSCPQHLLHYIHHNPDAEIAQLSAEHKKLLLQNAFGGRRVNGTTTNDTNNTNNINKVQVGPVIQKQVKLSKHVYNLVTCTEPEERINMV